MKTKSFVTKLVVMIFLAAFNTTNVIAQKSGVLKKDHYGAFTGDDWEEFLLGKRAGDFEPKSNVKLATYITVVDKFAKEVLGETSLNSAIANSTVVDFPADAKIVTANTAGEWITRDAYPGEKGYLHTGTKKLWLSFSCGNLVNVTIKPATPDLKSGSYTLSGADKSNDLLKLLGGTPGNNQLTNLLLATNQKSSEGSFSYADYSMGRNDRQNDFVVDAALFTMIQNNKQCCTNTTTTTTPAPTGGYTYTGAPTSLAAQQPTFIVMGGQTTKQKVPFGQSFGGQLLANTLGTAIGVPVGLGIYDLFNGNGGGCDHARGICNGSCGGGFNGGGTTYNEPFHAASPAGIASAASLIPGGNTNVYAGGGFNWRRN